MVIVALYGKVFEPLVQFPDFYVLLIDLFCINMFLFNKIKGALYILVKFSLF